MNEQHCEHLLIAAPQATADKLKGILNAAQIQVDEILSTGEAAIAALTQQPSTLLTVWKLDDMSGAELIQRAKTLGAMMIVPNDYEAEETDALMLRNPISQDALVQAVRAMCYYGVKMHALAEKTLKLERQLMERKIMERAKGRLMELFHLTEREAHHRLQKMSMDTGRRVADVAQEILDDENLFAE